MNKIRVEMKDSAQTKTVEINGAKVSINDISLIKLKNKPVEVMITFYADMEWISQSVALPPEPG